MFGRIVCDCFLSIFVLHAISSYQLFGTPYPAIVGETFELVCITTDNVITISNGLNSLLHITGGYPNGTCKTAGLYYTNYSYYCSPSNYTYKVEIPGIFNSHDKNGTRWSCQNLFGGRGANLIHLLAYPDVTIQLKPSGAVLVRKDTSVTFHCDVPIRESWQGTEIVDSILGRVVSFIRNGTSCKTNGDVLNSYNVTCMLSTGRFSAELLTTSSWYNGHSITCRALFGIGSKTKVKIFEAATTIAISGKNRLDISPLVVAFGTGISVTLYCHLNQHQTEVVWYANYVTFKRAVAAEAAENCTQSTMQDQGFGYSCDIEGRLFKLVIPPRYVTYGLNETSWTCGSSGSLESNAATFRILDMPEIATTEAIVCAVPGTVTLICNLTTSSIEYVEKAVWNHNVNGKLIRTLNGTWEETSFKLRIPFCTVQDTGVYICSMTTGLPNLEMLNKEVVLSVSGPPLFLDNELIRSETSLDLTAKFISRLTTELPIWRFQNRTLTSGSKYSSRTSANQIKTTFYNKEVTLDGFISTLRIFEYDEEDEGEYTVTVRNSFSSVTETVTVKFSHTLEGSEQAQIGYSGGILAGVAVGCVFGTIIAVLATYAVVKMIRSSGKVSKDEAKTNQNYDEIGMRSLPSVYDTMHES